MDSPTAAAVMAALGHGLRLELWRLLSPCGPSGMAAGMIAASLAVPPSSLSFHLQQMTHAGVLLQRRSSRHIIYAVNEDIITELRFFLGRNTQDLAHLSASMGSTSQTRNIVS